MTFHCLQIYTLKTCCLFAKGPQVFGEINHIPCSLHVRVAFQSGLELIWTLFRIKLHAFGKIFIVFVKCIRSSLLSSQSVFRHFYRRKWHPSLETDLLRWQKKKVKPRWWYESALRKEKSLQHLMVWQRMSAFNDKYVHFSFC